MNTPSTATCACGRPASACTGRYAYTPEGWEAFRKTCRTMERDAVRTALGRLWGLQGAQCATALFGEPTADEVAALRWTATAGYTQRAD